MSRSPSLSMTTRNRRQKFIELLQKFALLETAHSPSSLHYPVINSTFLSIRAVSMSAAF